MYRDYSADINFVDGNIQGEPRTEEKRREINNQLKTYASLLTKDYVGMLGKKGIRDISDLLSSSENLDDGDKIVVSYGKRFKTYVKSEFVN